MHPRHRNHALIPLLAITLACPAAQAFQTAPTVQPSTGTTPTTQLLRARITAVRGLVEVRASETQDWQPARVDMIVDEGAEFRTGPRSAVQFQIPPAHTITIDRLGVVKLLTAIQRAGKVKTDLGMKYGRTDYNIAVGGVEHESTIRSPNSTLAVRGTVFSVTDERPFPPTAVSFQGRVQYQALKRQTVAFGGKGKAKVKGDKNNAAESRYDETYVDPAIANARDAAEQQLIANLISTGAVVSLDRQSGIRVVKGGSVPADRDLLPLLPGNLNFVLRWQGNANLDFSVGTLRGNEVVYPAAGLTHSKSGGSIPFDHQGGPNGGIEIISWPRGFPLDTYQISVNHVSGPAAVPANVQSYRNGQRQPILTGSPSGGLVQVPEVNTTIRPVRPGREMTVVGLVDLSGNPLPQAQRALTTTGHKAGRK